MRFNSSLWASENKKLFLICFRLTRLLDIVHRSQYNNNNNNNQALSH